MNRIALTTALLIVAACLEVGGDAIVRVGLKQSGMPRIGLFVAGAAVLFGYGIFVNTAPADFGRLLGIYVALFFTAAQIINFAAFNVRPGAPIIVGGALIVAGGIVLSLWKA
jgi:small multidrug resistance family-3 protein